MHEVHLEFASVQVELRALAKASDKPLSFAAGSPYPNVSASKVCQRPLTLRNGHPVETA